MIAKTLATLEDVWTKAKQLALKEKGNFFLIFLNEDSEELTADSPRHQSISQQLLPPTHLADQSLSGACVFAPDAMIIKCHFSHVPQAHSIQIGRIYIAAWYKQYPWWTRLKGKSSVSLARLL